MPAVDGGDVGWSTLARVRHEQTTRRALQVTGSVTADGIAILGAAVIHVVGRITARIMQLSGSGVV